MTGLWIGGGEYSSVFVVTAWIVVVLAVIVLAISLMLVVHHGISARRRRRARVHERRAARVLGPELIEKGQILAAVTDAAERWDRRAVAMVLRRARPKLRGDLASEISEALEEIGEVDRLLDLASDKKAWRRASAIRALGECGGDRARRTLITATEDPSPAVRRAARDGLLVDRSPDGIKAAIDSYLLDAPLRTAWRRSFYARLAAVANAELRELLASGQLDHRETKLALEALGDARDPEVLPHAERFAESEDPELRATAVRVIGKLEDDSRISIVRGALDDPEWYVRSSAARAMATLDCSPDDCRRLSEKLDDEAWWVRANAAQALSEQGERGITMLLKVLEGDDRFGRHAALNALAFTDLTPRDQERLDRLLGKLPADGLDETAVRFLRANLALERP